jgi:hypothetical protein
MAAGLGFKTFTTGEVLSAGDTNGYLMQGVLVFASAAARDAAITSPQEGQACYLKDTDAVMTYSGSAWAAVGGTVSFNTGKNYVATSQSTTSTSYVGLTTAQAVTVTTGTKALVSISASFENAAGVNVGARMSFAISGATTVAAADEFSTGIAYLASGGGNLQLKYGATFLVTGLTAGSNVFTAQFKKGAGDTPGFAERTINVVNLGS